MSAGDQVLECLSHFMVAVTSDEGAWKAQDLKALASIQATCRSSRAICDRAPRTRKPIAKAHKANMLNLKKHIEYHVVEARDMSLELDREFWVHPFSGEFDYTDDRGMWLDNVRHQYKTPLTSQAIQDRDTALCAQHLGEDYVRLYVHHGLMDRSAWRHPLEETESESESESDEEM